MNITVNHLRTRVLVHLGTALATLRALLAGDAAHRGGLYLPLVRTHGQD